MHESFAELQQGRWIFPGDLSASFSGQGRLYAASAAPRRWSNVVERFRSDLQLDGRLDRELLVFVDEATPRDSDLWRQIIIMGIALLVMALSFFFWLRGRRRVRALEAAAAAAR